MILSVDTLDDPAYNRIVELLTAKLKTIPLPAGTSVHIGPSHVFDYEDENTEGWELPMFISLHGFTNDPNYDAVGYCCAHAGTPEKQTEWLLTQVADDLPVITA